MATAKRHQIPVIEDAAQATGARYRDRMVGSIGSFGCFSFFPAKNLGCFGDGGAVATNDDQLAAAVRLISNHGSKVRYLHETIGINSRLDTLQAAVLLAKLPHLEKWNEARIAIAARYDEAFADLPLQRPCVTPGTRHVYQQYSLRATERQRLLQHLENAHIPFAVHYPRPLHQQPAFAHLAPHASFPVAEAVANEILSLPMFPTMTPSEVDLVIEAVRSCYGD
jgi:dTDP-4-amino-4,6-dideoxygalactose transaminase